MTTNKTGPHDDDLAGIAEMHDFVAAFNRALRRASRNHPRDDIVSGNVWPDELDDLDRAYLDDLEREKDALALQVQNLEAQLARAEAAAAAALSTESKLHEAVQRLTAEEYAPPPHYPSHAHPTVQWRSGEL
jgi:hypothetical protein